MNTTTLNRISSDEFKAAMRKLTASVTLVTTNGANGKDGLTATAVTSLSDTPPSLIVCVNKSSSAHQKIIDNKVFNVHILSDEQEQLSNCFAGFTGKHGEDKFVEGNWQIDESSIKLEGALVNMECELSEYHDGFTHHIFIGVIRKVEIGQSTKPLLYGEGKYTSTK
ncbi:flavin reductase family protein [Flammeovirga sp. MY04]|uniref:flavin reductase family protein n=1 Tax=Flammeovirga sp. MY04 TaxID=1191459 RepID=UPI000826DC99|nr:flavin reductase family protein [Flammeovirga sp. MY04]ANQ48328.2 flavin reductase family protein [Flammeovirga sp. MY04]